MRLLSIRPVTLCCLPLLIALAPFAGGADAGRLALHHARAVPAGMPRLQGAAPSANPPVGWATYLGGQKYDGSLAGAVDAQGNVSITGATSSTNFPVTAGAAQAHFGGGENDAFVASYTAAGRLRWATYLGGSGADSGNGVAVDAQGNVYIIGQTRSDPFPLTRGAAQSSYIGNGDQAFVASFTANGRLRWSTYLGGTDADDGNGIAADAQGNVYVIGTTSSFDFPVTPGAAQQRHGESATNSFITSYTTSGRVRWSTYLGGTNFDEGHGVAVDGKGNVYVTGKTDADTGQTHASNFPVTAGAAQTRYGGAVDAFVAAYSASGKLRWATYLGGPGTDNALGITADGTGTVYVTGGSNGGFPVTSGAAQPRLGGTADGFLAAYSASGKLRWATYLGGPGDDSGIGIAADGTGNVYVTGVAGAGFPVTAGTAQPAFQGVFDAFVAGYTASGRLRWATYLGGKQGDIGSGIGVDRTGNVYVSGITASVRFPVTASAAQRRFGGAADAFVVRMAAP